MLVLLLVVLVLLVLKLVLVLVAVLLPLLVLFAAAAAVATGGVCILAGRQVVGEKAAAFRATAEFPDKIAQIEQCIQKWEHVIKNRQIVG